MLSRSARYTIAGLAAFAFATAGAAAIGFRSKPADPRAEFRNAAVAVGVTDELREELRTTLTRAMIALENDGCDEIVRDRAGKAAVAYYETLLEKPFAKARLHMTRRGVCAVTREDLANRADPLSLVADFQNGLRLPWDCMPIEWRTPSDLALQAKIESSIRSYLLSSEDLKGTLGILAKSWENSSLWRRCRAKQFPNSSNSRSPLPLIASPPDDWDRTPRRRRF